MSGPIHSQSREPRQYSTAPASFPADFLQLALPRDGDQAKPRPCHMRISGKTYSQLLYLKKENERRWKCFIVVLLPSERVNFNITASKLSEFGQRTHRVIRDPAIRFRFLGLSPHSWCRTIHNSRGIKWWIALCEESVYSVDPDSQYLRRNHQLVHRLELNLRRIELNSGELSSLNWQLQQSRRF